MMHWQYTPYVLPLLIAAAVSATIAFFAWRRRPAPGAMPLVCLALAASEWSLGYAVGMASADLPAKVFWAKVQYFGIVSVPIMWLFLALQYTGREGWLTRRNRVLLAIMPLLTLLLAWTNESHGLIWSDLRLDTSGSFSVLYLTYGAFFWIHVIYSYSLILLGSVLFLQMLVRSPHLYRRQAVAMLIAALAPWVGNVLRISGLNPFPHLDLTNFAFTLSGLAVAWALFPFRLLDLVPVAREAVIEGMGDGVIVLDAQNRIVDINPAAGHIFGRSVSEAIGQPAAQVLYGPPDGSTEASTVSSAEPLAEALVERYREATEAQAEIVLGKGEAQRTFDLRMSPLYDRRGRLTGRLVVLRDITEQVRTEEELRKHHDHLEELVAERTDELTWANEQLQQEITERKRAEEALRESERRESEEKYRVLFETAKDAIFLSDETGRFVDVNQAACESLGYSKEELLKLSNREIDADPRGYEESLKAWDGRMKEMTFEVNQRRKDGTLLPVEVTGSFFTIGGQRIALAIARDISERRRAEAALRESEDKFRTIFETATDMITYVDQHGKILDVNSRVEDLLGYKRDEVIGKNFARLGVLGLRDLPKVVRLFRDTIRDGEAVTIVELELKHKNGKKVFVEVGTKFIKKNGKVEGVVNTFRDITERKRAEEALRKARDELEMRVAERTAELARANEQLRIDVTERKRAEEQIQASLREKEVLLREVLHRVKNNLQVISSLLDMRSLRTADQQTIDFLTDARAKVHTMALIHSQLYQSERVDQIDMGNHAWELVNYLSQVYATKSRLITPVIEPSDVYLSITQAIPCALILNEVISNAFKHAFQEGQKGTIEISIRREANDTIFLRVKDDGIGLPEAIDVDTTGSLGLKLIRNLVQEQLKGRLQIKRDKGTEVAVEFPILKEEVEHA
jgi:PAS domain S-box-containing protein